MSVTPVSLTEIGGNYAVSGTRQLKIASRVAITLTARGRSANRCRTPTTAVRLAPRFFLTIFGGGGGGRRMSHSKAKIPRIDVPGRLASFSLTDAQWLSVEGAYGHSLKST